MPNKQCSTCKFWERRKEVHTENGECKYNLLPFYVFISAHDDYTNEEDGSDCNAYQSKEEVDVLERDVYANFNSRELAQMLSKEKLTLIITELQNILDNQRKEPNDN